MPNARRGEIGAVLDGRPRTLVLTLGALAELEEAFGVQDLMALAERFGQGRLAARDAVRILHAGLRGAGEDVTLDEVAQMRAEGGAAGFARIVSSLLTATFGTEAEAGDLPGAPQGPSGPQQA
ncbi:MAG: gene transfer agent family protein [Xanthobacter sp.]